MFIAIEGVDSSGKETQTALLFERLLAEGVDARRLSFPDYASRASEPVRMYLEGAFGRNPADVNAYAASAFFAVDRYASWKTGWGAYLNAGGLVVSDRYTMSNMIHQGAKLEGGDEELRAFLDWVADLEFRKFGLPAPDAVIFLDMSEACRERLLRERARKGGSGGSGGLDSPDAKDIHEADAAYLRRAHACAQKIAAWLGWTRVSAESDDGMLRSPADIHEEIWRAVQYTRGRFSSRKTHGDGSFGFYQ